MIQKWKQKSFFSLISLFFSIFNVFLLISTNIFTPKLLKQCGITTKINYWKPSRNFMSLFRHTHQTFICLKEKWKNKKKVWKLTIKTPKQRHWHHCYLWTYFTPFSVSIVEFLHVFVCWVFSLTIALTKIKSLEWFDTRF